MDLLTQQRLQDPSDFDLDLKILALAQPAAGLFRVHFSDGHEASFSADVVALTTAVDFGFAAVTFGFTTRRVSLVTTLWAKRSLRVGTVANPVTSSRS